jgi:hypothetical protein
VGTGPAGQFYIKQVRTFALMSKDYGKINNMADLISGRKVAGLVTALDAAQIKQASTEPIWGYANVAKISDVYKKEISEAIDEIKKQAIKQQTQTQKMPSGMAGMTQMMDAFAAVAKDFMQQTKSMTLACNPKPDVLNFRTTVNALPGTEMATTLVADTSRKGKNDLIGYTEDGAVMNGIGWMDHTLMKKIYSKVIDLMALAAGKDPNSEDNVKIKKLSDEMIDAIGDRFVFTFSADPNSKPFFAGKEIITVKDANQFSRTVNEFAKTWVGSSFDDFYKKMGMDVNFTIKQGVDNYKGITIDAASFNMKLTDANAPEAKMIEAMYGTGFNYRWAAVGNMWVCSVSSDPNAVYKLIDQAKAGAPSQICPEMQKAIAYIPDADRADIVFTYNYLRLFKMMSAMMPVPMPPINMPSKSNLVFAARAADGSMIVDAALPKEHLQEMMMVFQMMMQMQMQQQMQMQKQSPQ